MKPKTACQHQKYSSSLLTGHFCRLPQLKLIRYICCISAPGLATVISFKLGQCTIGALHQSLSTPLHSAFGSNLSLYQHIRSILNYGRAQLVRVDSFPCTYRITAEKRQAPKKFSPTEEPRREALSEQNTNEVFLYSQIFMIMNFQLDILKFILVSTMGI